MKNILLISLMFISSYSLATIDRDAIHDEDFNAICYGITHHYAGVLINAGLSQKYDEYMDYAEKYRVNSSFNHETLTLMQKSLRRQYGSTSKVRLSQLSRDYADTLRQCTTLMRQQVTVTR